MPRKVIVTIAILSIAAALVGCGQKKAAITKVQNPPEKIPKVEKLPPPDSMQTPPRPEPGAASSTAATASAPAPGANGWVKTSSGLEYKDKKVGKGTAAKAGDSVTVQYKGWLDNGKVFDTSRKPGREPFRFVLGGGQVIKGWDEGVAGMKVGGVRELKIPASLGYGDAEMGEIPANSTLHFDVELLQING